MFRNSLSDASFRVGILGSGIEGSGMIAGASVVSFVGSTPFGAFAEAVACSEVSPGIFDAIADRGLVRQGFGDGGWNVGAGCLAGRVEASSDSATPDHVTLFRTCGTQPTMSQVRTL